MALEVKPLESKADFKRFMKFPYQVYRGGKERYDSWVPPLDMDVKHLFDRKHNGLFDHAELQEYLAWRDGEVVGRIVAIVDRAFCEFQNTKTGFIGFLECFDDAEVASALFSTAEAWIKERGMERIMGPVHGSTNYQLGNQIDSFDELPVIEMPYNPPYYGALYEAAGYKKDQDLYSYKMRTDVLNLSDKIVRVAELAQKRSNVEIRNVDMKNWKRDLDYVRDMWDDAWTDNWGYVPWNKQEFDQLADGLKMAIMPDITLFAYVDGEPVGFAFPIPDLNPVFHGLDGKLLPFGVFKLLAGKSKVDTVRIAAFGVRKAYQNKGIDALFVYELYKRAVDMGIKTAEFSWILESNLRLRNMLENWGAEHYRTHRVYAKEL
jgi:GNAT superfamily N-acetyltransferase